MTAARQSSRRSPRWSPLIPLLALAVLLPAGCVSTRPPRPGQLAPGMSRFLPLGEADFRDHAPGGPDDLDRFRRMTRAGDLVVVRMKPGRAVLKGQWLFTLLPPGHAFIVLDPDDPAAGLLECRFRGARRVGFDDLPTYTRTLLFRLEGPDRLNVGRLREFAAQSQRRTTAYNFGSWLGRNDFMQPETPDDISPQYTCSTYLAAAYHYAGATLSASAEVDRVVTPLSLAASAVTWNRHAMPAGPGDENPSANAASFALGPATRPAAPGRAAPQWPGGTKPWPVGRW